VTLDLVEVAKLAVQAAEVKKGRSARHFRHSRSFRHRRLLCHCKRTFGKQVQSIATGVKDSLEEAGVHVRGVEGYDQGRWVLIDAGDVVIHIFHRDERDFYDLERLWGDAKTVGVQ